jgi:hypothetical protein
MAHDTSFSDRLKSLMKSKGIKNNNRLAQAIKKPPPVTLKWLKGTIPTNPEDWKLLCEFFGVTADYLLLGRQDHHNHLPQEQVLRIKFEDHANADYSLVMEPESKFSLTELKEEHRHDVRRADDRFKDKLILFFLSSFLKIKIPPQNEDNRS